MSAEELDLRIRIDRPSFDLDVSERLELSGVTAVFGPSGSGKSTLLRAIAGFEKPAPGRIAAGDGVWFDSEKGIDVAPHRRPVGFMFQDARLFAHLDVARNLAYGERRRRGRLEGFDRADVISALDLGPLLARAIDSLSGGERQRVALGRTLLVHPELLLLDEPLSALDRERKADILPYLEAVTERFRIPTFYVSHDIDEVAQLADRVLVLVDGRVSIHGPTAAIVERLDLQPITGRFEAGVLLEGRVVRHDVRLHLTHLDVHGDALTMPMIERIPPGGTIRFRIRARDVALATRRPEGLSIRNVLPGTLTDLVVDPETGIAHALVQLQADRIRARLTQAAVEDLGLETGMSVFALVKSVSFERGG